MVLCAFTFALLAAEAASAWGAYSGPKYGQDWWILSMKTFIAGTTEIRFCLGHRNYLTMLKREHVPGDPTIWRRGKWDFLLICILVLCKALTSVEISNSPAFINGFTALMLADALWIFFEKRVRSLDNVGTFKPCRWMWINIGTALLILIGSRLLQIPSVQLCAIGTMWQLSVAAANSVADLCCCSGPMCPRQSPGCLNDSYD